MIEQPCSEREQWLSRCEEQLAVAKAQARVERGRTYLVTRPVKGEPFTTTWSEGLVRHFLARHRYVQPERWLAWFGESTGCQTSFGWVKLKPSKPQEVSHAHHE